MAAKTQIKTILHGSLHLKSRVGAPATPLDKVVPFVDGGLQYTENFPTNEIRDRQELSGAGWNARRTGQLPVK